MVIYNQQSKVVISFKVKSTKGIKFYNINLYDNGKLDCDCSSFKFNELKSCKHIRSKREEIGIFHGNIKNYIDKIKQENENKI